MADMKINVFLISRSLKKLQQCAYEPIRKDTGLTQMDLQIVFTIYQFPVPATVGSIHKHTYFNKGQISVCVANLLKKGYIKKAEFNSQFDAYVLTEKGNETAGRIERNTAQGRKRLFKDFTQEEVNMCRDFLNRMLENAQNCDPKSIKFK